MGKIRVFPSPPTWDNGKEKVLDFSLELDKSAKKGKSMMGVSSPLASP